METLECSTGENGFGSTNPPGVISRFSALQNSHVTQVTLLWGSGDVGSQRREASAAWGLREAIPGKRVFEMNVPHGCCETERCTSLWQSNPDNDNVPGTVFHRGFLRRSRGCCSQEGCMAQWVMDGWWSFLVGVKFILRQVIKSLMEEGLRIWEGRITNRMANSREPQQRGCFHWREWGRVTDFACSDWFSFSWLKKVSQCYSGKGPPTLLSGWNLLQVPCGGGHRHVFDSVTTDHSHSPHCYLRQTFGYLTALDF